MKLNTAVTMVRTWPSVVKLFYVRNLLMLVIS